MGKKCFACGKFLSADAVTCGTCASIYHRQCSGIAGDARLPNRWQCKNCKSKPKQKNVTPESVGSGSTLSDFGDAVSDGNLANSLNLAEEIKVIREQLSTIVQETTNCRQEMASFRKEVVKLNSTVADFHNRLNNVEEQVNTITKRLAVAEAKMVASSESVLAAKIEQQLNDRDQESYLTDVEISGLEEAVGENTTHLVMLVAKKIGVPLEERDIVSVERKGRRQVAGGDGDNAPRRPRVLVARLSRRALRNELIAAARVRRGADTAGITSTTQPRRMYINERLTWYNRRLFHCAREEGRSKGWRFMWTRDGRIFARRDRESQAFRIRTDDDIDRVFGNK